MTRQAKVFTNGRSQAVRVPSEFRFDTKEVNIRRDPATGDIVLSQEPRSLARFFEILGRVGPAEPEFLAARERTPQLRRKLF